MTTDIDLRIYIITDASFGKSHEEVAEAAIIGGATVIQMRDKHMSPDAFLKTAERIRSITADAGVAFIVNDRVDIAIKTAADGIHIGQDDMPIDRVKGLIPDGMCLGLSVSDLSQAVKARALGPSYMGVGPVFPTDSKKDAASPLGTDILKEIVDIADVPIVAVGGITESNLKTVIDAGVNGAAVIKEVAGAEDMVGATRRLSDIWRRCGH